MRDCNFRVTVIGHVGVDVITICRSELDLTPIQYSDYDCEIKNRIGGTGIILSEAAHELGCSTATIGKVGNDGIVPYPSQPNNCYGGHAICATGFNDDKKLIKFKNSWGKGWGQNGYGYISYDYINDFMWDAWTCNDISVTRDMLKETKSLL